MPLMKKMIKAKKEKFDEFYTQFEDIQKEMNAYIEFDKDVFRNKTILLPCDDPEWSNFTKFFAQNFERYGLKKLISTSYSFESKKLDAPYQLSLFEQNSPKYDEKKTKTHGKVFILDRDENKNGKIDINDLKWDYLEGDGDFRSSEVKRLRDEADIIITNPPFSLITQFIPWILEAKKQFIILGKITIVGNKEVFPLIKNNEMWLGPSITSGDRKFRIPKELFDETKVTGKIETDSHGNKYVRVVGVRWFTNIDHGRRHQPLQLMSMEDNLKFSKHEDLKKNGYIKYDNYDALEVPYIDAIPNDYYGIMGVPVSIMDKYCPEQFRILCATQTGCHPDNMILKSYKTYIGYHQNGTLTGRTGSTCGHNPMLAVNDGIHDYYKNENGEIVQSANSRIFIERIKNNEDNIEN